MLCLLLPGNTPVAASLLVEYHPTFPAIEELAIAIYLYIYAPREPSDLGL